MDNRYENDLIKRGEKYRKASDEVLVSQAREGDNYALEFVLTKYKNLVRKKARTYFLIGADKDDIIQEGMIGLYKAIRDFNKEKSVSFKAFAELCVTRQMISAVKASTRQKHVPLNSYISLNKPLFEEGDEQHSLMDYMPSKKVINPEDLLIDKENLSMIEYELDSRLSALEKEVLSLYLEGKTYDQIAYILERTVKSIDNALQRIKKKVETIVLEKNA